MLSKVVRSALGVDGGGGLYDGISGKVGISGRIIGKLDSSGSRTREPTLRP